jgi:hypothetical protein
MHYYFREEWRVFAFIGLDLGPLPEGRYKKMFAFENTAGLTLDKRNVRGTSIGGCSRSLRIRASAVMLHIC